MSAQRRPVMSFDFRETPIKAVTEDLDGNIIYIGNGSGDLASVDIRTGKLLGCFLGKCSGSIRSIARHPDLPVIASCGLDSYLRIWDIKSRQLLSAVFLKQHLTNVVFDSHFDGEAVSLPPSERKNDAESVDRDKESPLVIKRIKKKSSKSRSLDENEEESLSVKHKKAKKSRNLAGEDEGSHSAKRKKAKKSQNVDEDEEESISSEQKKVQKSQARSKGGKSKKAKKSKGESIDV